MNISEIDKNLRRAVIKETDVLWKNARDYPFSLHGVFYSEEEKRYRRMPKAVAEAVSPSVGVLSTNTAGGRVRFRTDSPYITVKAVLPSPMPGTNMSMGMHSGFAVYSDGVFEGNPRPEWTDLISVTGERFTIDCENVAAAAQTFYATLYRDGRFAFESIVYARNVPNKNFNGGGLEKETKLQKGNVRNIDLYFPLYNGVYELYIGVKEGSVVEPALPYPNAKPVVFYGSSITQGGSASHAGNDYVSVLSRRLNFDFINLGFSGNAKGEPVMADYLAGLQAEVMVLDYDFNSPTAETLQQTHYPLYEKIRKAQPNTPIIFMTRPNFLYDPTACVPRREVIYQTYLRAKEQGDKLVAFIDGETLLGKDDWFMCTVDNCHPNDLGFYRMAERVEPVLKDFLDNKTALD